jgi:hypothetical protein
MTPWWIGLGATFASVVYVGYQFTKLDCGPATTSVLAFIVLGASPTVYLFLMRLDVQELSESGRRDQDKAATSSHQ